ncbi:MAG: hypothetical protein HYR55_12605 [Acidobacteria bacterium]|nr:hypothetical protein [Acidobacteriota bacterium]MBI3656525.1 hypothetical protein [Acidobacteriota bacterium]
MKSVYCFHCSGVHQFLESVPRKETCAHCGSDMHCCRNCVYYDPRAPRECREPVAELVRYKDRANFCDYFDPRKDEMVGGEKKAVSHDQARKAWDNLFKK